MMFLNLKGQAMKLGIWIKENNLTQETFVAYSQSHGAKFSRHAVAKWCSGARIPRPHEMSVIHKVTDSAVTPNDFYGLQTKVISPNMG
jgi:hypothetical protein